MEDIQKARYPVDIGCVCHMDGVAMNYIKKAVELAEGWDDDNEWSRAVLMTQSQRCLDALAAQLVRQVDALGTVSIMYDDKRIIIRNSQQKDIFDIGFYQRNEVPGRTMNTIKAIIDSGVLE